ncbi:MAG: hypothetical protein EBT52_00480 [Flavobacteriia bacterium]|nr:hypothetical protein [Flavobacteriia bacterium]
MKHKNPHMLHRISTSLWVFFLFSTLGLQAQNWEDRMSFSATLIYFQPFTDLNDAPPVNNRLNLSIPIFSINLGRERNSS